MSNCRQKVDPVQFAYTDCGSRMPSCVPKDMAFVQGSSLAPAGGIGIGKYSPIALQRARERAKPASATIDFHNVSTGLKSQVTFTSGE